jgi:hypothetical protein
MKKYILLLLFIPIMSFGQITYNDLMSIKSVDTFKKVVIENGYEADNTGIDDELINYGYNITKDSINGNKATKWAVYSPSNDVFVFKFSRSNVVDDFFGSEPDNSTNEYDLIVKELKAKCKYFKIREFDENDYVTYSCSESSYTGKIGFMVSDGFGYIMHFPNP